MLDGDVENAKFDALVNLLYLRSNVLEPRPFYNDVDAEEDHVDVESHCLDIIHSGGPENSKDRFLDGFAELASNHKGGQHVKCSALQEQGDEVLVYVSSNSAFSSADEVFFAQLQSRLTELCNQCKGHGSSLEQSNAASHLWDEMVDYNLPRLNYYAEQLATLLSQPDNQAVFRSAEINPEESALLAEIIGMFRQYSYRGTLSKDQVRPLLDAAYAARHIHTVRSQLKSSASHTSKATALWTRICFLGRLRATFFKFLRFTEDSPNIERFYIRFVSLQSSREPSTQRHSMDLDGALALLPDAGRLIITELLKRKRTVDVANSAKRVKRKWTRARLSARFDVLRAEPRYLHAEMQLLLYLAEHSSLERTYAYLGRSKYCCPLCWMFLQCQGKFRTRGCHANMYHKWLVPTASEYASGTTRDEMQKVAAKVKNDLIYHLSTGSIAYNNPRAESSLGLTTASLSQMTIKDYDDQDLQQRRRMQDAMHVRSPSPSFHRPLGSSTNIAGDTEVDDGCAADGLNDDPAESASYRQCVICNASPAYRCRQCASVFYCGTDCQRDDWKLHKRLCSKTSSFFGTRPSPEHRACIFIPETRNELEWVWAETKIIPDDICPWRQAQIKPWLGGESINVGGTPIPLNPRRDRLLDHTVKISHREDFLKDGSGTNKCLLELAGTVPHTWKGPIVLVRQNQQTESCMDAKLEDLRHAIDYLSWYSHDREYTQNTARIARMPYKPICAIKVNCKGDQAVFGLDPYIPIEINRHHYLFSPHARLDLKSSRPKIAELIGVPLLLRQSGHDQAWERDPSQPANVYDNQPITFLNMCANPTSPHWGWAPLQWQNDVGSVIVARADQQDITPRQLEAICSYCQTELQREFECSLGCGLVQRTKQYVLEMMTPAAFRMYFYRYREERLEEELGWEDEVCPVLVPCDNNVGVRENPYL